MTNDVAGKIALVQLSHDISFNSPTQAMSYIHRSRWIKLKAQLTFTPYVLTR